MTSRPESEWNDEQRGWMFALAEYRAHRCPGCGHDLRETTAHEREHTWQTKRDRCHACTTVAEAKRAERADAEKKKSTLPAEGVLWSVTKVR